MTDDEVLGQLNADERDDFENAFIDNASRRLLGIKHLSPIERYLRMIAEFRASPHWDEGRRAVLIERRRAALTTAVVDAVGRLFAIRDEMRPGSLVDEHLEFIDAVTEILDDARTADVIAALAEKEEVMRHQTTFIQFTAFSQDDVRSGTQPVFISPGYVTAVTEYRGMTMIWCGEKNHAVQESVDDVVDKIDASVTGRCLSQSSTSSPTKAAGTHR